MTRRSDLRAQTFEMSGGRCEYPFCDERASSLAHLHSIGLGGRKSADTIDNVMAACSEHALLTDGGIPGNRGRLWYENQLALVGIVPPFKAWNIAEAIRTAVLEARGKRQYPRHGGRGY